MYFFDLENNFFYGDMFSYHFNPDGTYNGKSCWISDDETVKVIWDTTLNAWKLSGDSLASYQVINTNPVEPPINGSWYVIGASYDVVSNEGSCVSVDGLNFTYTKLNPECSCDGTISINANGGIPPYQYSINAGITYGNSPIVHSLCGGDYTVMVKDSNGDVQSQLVHLNSPQPQTNYIIHLNTLSQTNLTGNSVKTDFVINITPALPNGVTITFDMNLLGGFRRTPYDLSASSSFTSQVIKNGTPIVSYTDNTTETTSPNYSPGCQNQTYYNTNYSYLYQNLTINNSDVYTISIVTDYTLDCNYTPFTISSSEIGPLEYGQSAAQTYSICCDAQFSNPVSNSYIMNPTISGCNCCNVLAAMSLYE